MASGTIPQVEIGNVEQDSILVDEFHAYVNGPEAAYPFRDHMLRSRHSETSISLSLCRKAQQCFSWTTAHVGKLNVPWALSRLHRDQLASSVACSIEHRIFSATGGFANAWCTIVTFFENNCLARILCDWVWTRLHRIAARDGCHDRRNQHCTLH